MKQYLVITTDMIDSKKYPNINQILKPKLNGFSPPGLTTPFVLSRGDEFQALCHDFSHLPIIMRHLRYLCQPCRLRIGLGIGTIDETEISQSSWEMTGEAFFKAREALDVILKDKIPKTYLLSGNNAFDISFNTIYSLLDLIEDDWTDGQWEAVQVIEKETTYVKAAEALSVTRQNVRKLCQAAKWDFVQSAEENLKTLLGMEFPPNQENG